MSPKTWDMLKATTDTRSPGQNVAQQSGAVLPDQIQSEADGLDAQQLHERGVHPKEAPRVALGVEPFHFSLHRGTHRPDVEVTAH
eukprot:CAMPEP_0177549472 /NCGR_PEP_ID=MMETSP0369-20130122/65048_1 /TAXON_ID=447022 ORGANISM="Scrippsiella hangoei-like, Strain SHHI-4" /NCGR_SAMPLE_ID=MMETSP0369 /ASSEMBLY_ACC=CAM_ASM_000364 /LENGTH=84 /DNA_ID=CAMNT_0019034591 /DNA_START=61 /DNA_END=311 /DNA_ORIENTATION=+